LLNNRFACRVNFRNKDKKLQALKNKSHVKYYQKHDFAIVCVPHLERPGIFPIWSSRSRDPHPSHWTAIHNADPPSAVIGAHHLLATQAVVREIECLTTIDRIAPTCNVAFHAPGLADRQDRPDAPAD